MATIRVEVCDVCKDIRRAAIKYRIGDSSGLRRVSLCREHAGDTPLSQLLTLSLKIQRPRAAFTPTTMEEVAAAKKTTVKPVKRVTRKRA